MGHVVHMLFIIISFYCFCNHILSVHGYYLSILPNASTNNGGSFTLTPTHHFHTQVEQNAFFFHKFRLLLGLIKNLNNGRKPRNGDSIYLYPSPSPAPSPIPTPSLGVHPPSMHHHRHSLPEAHKIHNNYEAGRRGKRVFTAVVASVGVTCLLFCAIALFFGCQKFNKQRSRKRRKSVLVFRSEAGGRGISKLVRSQSSATKVSSDPGPDLFYLDSIQSALEQDKYCLGVNISTSNCTALDDGQGSNKKLMSSESEMCGEIRYEISESVKHEPNNAFTSNSEQVVYILDDTNLSDDESFHSFCDSHSSQLRLSNASTTSLVEETSEIISQYEVNQINCSQLKPLSIPPPPPPPPLPIPSSEKMKSNFVRRPSPNLSQTSFQENAHSQVPHPPCPLLHLDSQKALPPPPPPQLNAQQVPLGKDGSPLPKLKPLHWDKVRAAPNRLTVWDKLRSSSFEFDEEMIESLFGYNLQNQLIMKNDEGKSKTPSPSKHVLEPKRLQNITILSKGLNVTTQQVCGALIRGDGLSLQDLEALSKMVPTKEEEAKLSNYKGDLFELDSAEKLVKAIIKIPFAFSRIESMLYKETFEDEVFHLRKSFSMLQEACKELRSSRLFLKLLEAVLKTGNRMNVGTIRGGAKAFKLDALLKLADVKGTDGKTTLLHFVVQEIIRSEGVRVSESIMGKIHQISKSSENVEDKEEKYRKMGLDLVSSLSTELCNAKKTATIDLDVLASSVANLSDGMRKLKNLVEKDMLMEDKKGSFVNSMRLFLNYAEMKLKELQEDENRVLLQVREITEYFHGDVSKDESNPLRIFVIVRDFLSMLDNVCKELRSKKAPRSTNPLLPFR